MNWKTVAAENTLSEDFIFEHVDSLPIEELVFRDGYSLSFLDRLLEKKKHITITEGNFISRKLELAEWFIEKYASSLDWECICRLQSMSSVFIEKMDQKEYIDWGMLSANPHLTEEFIETHNAKFNWSTLGIFSRFSEEFMEKHEDKINWNEIWTHQAFSLPFVQKREQKVNWESFSNNRFLAEDILHYYKDKWDWNTVCYATNLSERFMEEKKDTLNWSILCEFQEMTLPFVKEMIAYINIPGLQQNINIRFTKEEWNEIQRLKGWSK